MTSVILSLRTITIIHFDFTIIDFDETLVK